MKPIVRKHNIHVEKLPEEVALYDKGNHSVHCLNNTVATVWENADGTRTIEELAQIVNEKFGIAEGRDVVLVALDQLEQANLLEAPSEQDVEELPSRRSIGRKLVLTGLSAAVLPALATPTGRRFSKKMLVTGASAGAAVPAIASIFSPSHKESRSHAH